MCMSKRSTFVRTAARLRRASQGLAQKIDRGPEQVVVFLSQSDEKFGEGVLMRSQYRRDQTLGGMPMSRRRLLQGATALAGGAAATSAGLRRADAQDGQELRFWNLFGGGDGVRLLEMQESFRAANPDIDLKAVTFAWGPPLLHQAGDVDRRRATASGGRAPRVTAAVVRSGWPALAA